MKAVIDGKLYDTGKAEKVCTNGNGYPCNDFHYANETLYLTKNAAWFLEFDGGPLSQYGRAVGTERHGAQGIRPLTDDEAYQWLEQNEEVELILYHYPGRIEEA